MYKTGPEVKFVIEFIQKKMSPLISLRLYLYNKSILYNIIVIITMFQNTTCVQNGPLHTHFYNFASHHTFRKQNNGRKLEI